MQIHIMKPDNGSADVYLVPGRGAKLPAVALKGVTVSDLGARVAEEIARLEAARVA